MPRRPPVIVWYTLPCDVPGCEGVWVGAKRRGRVRRCRYHHAQRLAAQARKRMRRMRRRRAIIARNKNP